MAPIAHVPAHPGYDVPFALLGEESQRKGEHLVVYHHPDISDHSRAERHHDSRRPEIAGCLEQCHHDQDKPEYHQCGGAFELVYELGAVVVHVVRDVPDVFPEIESAVPGDEVVSLVVYVEQQLEDRYYEGEREYVENSREEVEEQTPTRYFL